MMRELNDDLIPIAANLMRSRSKLVKARREVDALWDAHVSDIRSAHASGLSLERIASICGVSKSRIWQIVTGRNK